MIEPPKIMVMAGGTGGHIFPGIAVAENLQKKGWMVYWLGSKNGMEESLIKKFGFNLSLMQISGVRGKGVVKKIVAPFKLILSIYHAIRIIKKINPDLVLGMGGFVSGPGGVAAWLLNRPLVIHEQNAVAGYTNRILAHISTQTTSAFDGVFADKFKTVKVGNPIRSMFTELAQPSVRFSDRTGAIRILIIGGSRGAKILNDTLPKVLSKLNGTVEIIHQTGVNNSQLVKQNYHLQNTNNHKIQVKDFIDNMGEVLSWADVAICRSGALTISELMTIGLGAILIPYPLAVDDHQTENAKIMVVKKSAVIIHQKDFSEVVLATRLNNFSREKAQEWAKNAIDITQKNATENLSELCKQQLRMQKI